MIWTENFIIELHEYAWDFEHVAYLLGDLIKKYTIYFILLSLSQQNIFAKFLQIILKINIDISVERFVFFLQNVCAMMYWWHWHHQEIFENSREFVLMLKFCWCFSYFIFILSFFLCCYFSELKVSQGDDRNETRA